MPSATLLEEAGGEDGRRTHPCLMDECDEVREMQRIFVSWLICLTRWVNATLLWKFLNTVTPDVRVMDLQICSY